MASDYLCNFVIPGAAKSGTSSLHGYLASHPMISMSLRKEPHHFCRDDRYCEGSAVHNELFEPSAGVTHFGESSTGYLPSRSAAERIARDLDRPKAIILLRHPVARCFSHYRWRVRLGLEKRSFLDALKADGHGYDPHQVASYGYMAYLQFSGYDQQCEMWKSVLGEANCLFVSSEELSQKRDEVLNSCFEFLGVPFEFPVSVSAKKNTTSELNRRPTKSMKRIARLMPKTISTSRHYQSIKNRILRSITPSPPISIQTVELDYLKKHLADDIAWYCNQFGLDEEAGFTV